jgi:putative endonuclease
MTKKELGAWGETAASNYLAGKGYEIKLRNLRLGNQEVDLVCVYQSKLIVVEVKTRLKGEGLAEEMFGRSKIRNLKIAAVKIRYLFPEFGRVGRFDLLALELDTIAKKLKIRHYKDVI